VSTSADVTALLLDSYVEDPNRPGVALQKGAGTRGGVSLAGSNPANFDLALTVSRTFINRILQLSYLRGYINSVQAKPGQAPLKMTMAPAIDAYQPTAGQDTDEPKIVLHLGLSSPVTGFINDLFINKAVSFQIDLIGRLVHLPTDSGLHIALDTFDHNSLNVDDSTLTFLGRAFRGEVVNGVLKQLEDATSTWSSKPNMVDGKLPLPPELFGQTLVTQNMRMDKNGYIVLFLNFPAEGAANVVP
jgi:hypothetical protein